MLHLHSLVWLAGNLEFFTLGDRLQTDPVFAGRVIRYISSVIKCTIDVFTGGLDDVPALTQTPSARDPERLWKPSTPRRYCDCLQTADA
jgi:hypothetical protein